jgi:FlaG/FlaF family flagellin (archaellin)
MKMVNVLDDFLIGLKLNIIKAGEKFRDESGVSAFVATILLIVIVVALCALFWTNISTWFSEQWTKITENAATVGGETQ